MRLSDAALAAPEEAPAEEMPDADSAGIFEDAVSEAFDLFGQGKKPEAAAAMKAAIQACVADYQADE